MEDAYRRGAMSSTGDLEVISVEHTFGRFSTLPDSEEMELLLGREPIPVRGRIDALVRRTGVEGGSSGLKVVDFKAGTSDPGTSDQVSGSLVRPQLAFYALVAAAWPDGLARGASVEGLSYDRVRTNKELIHEFDEADIDRVRAALSSLLDRGRDGDWLQLPHPDGCPLVGGGRAHCDLQEFCRLRPSFAPEAAS